MHTYNTLLILNLKEIHFSSSERKNSMKLQCRSKKYEMPYWSISFPSA